MDRSHFYEVDKIGLSDFSMFFYEFCKIFIFIEKEKNNLDILHQEHRSISKTIKLLRPPTFSFWDFYQFAIIKSW
jgi:hypothetical protein